MKKEITFCGDVFEIFLKEYTISKKDYKIILEKSENGNYKKILTFLKYF